MNNVSLLGRLTKELDLKYVGDKQIPMVNFTLAVNRKFKKEGQSDADFIMCTAFGKTAEALSKYIDKGRQIVVNGRIQTDSWEKDGKKEYSTKIIIDEFYFADSKKSEQDVSKSEQVESITADSDDLPF